MILPYLNSHYLNIVKKKMWKTWDSNYSQKYRNKNRNVTTWKVKKINNNDGIILAQSPVECACVSSWKCVLLEFWHVNDKVLPHQGFQCGMSTEAQTEAVRGQF